MKMFLTCCKYCVGKMNKCIIGPLLVSMFFCIDSMAQYVYGTTGLLHMPTAEMQRDKTFMFGGSFLDIYSTPAHWRYGTFNYYINITIFPWLEIGYTCTLHKGEKGWPEQTWGKFVNQDRQFSGRLRVLREGQLWKYMPAVVLGANDPSTNDAMGNPKKNDYGITGVAAIGNGYWNRYYCAFTKHFVLRNMGDLGTHLAYVYNRRKDYPLNGPTIGVNFRFQLPGNQPLIKAINNLNLMAEYDSRTINCGFEYSFCKDYINTVVELNQCRYFSGGLVFKVHLK